MQRCGGGGLRAHPQATERSQRGGVPCERYRDAMQPGWILGTWVAAVAAMLGVLVAAVTGASAPPWWLLALLVALPGAVTLGVRLRSHRSSVTASPHRGERAVVEQDLRNDLPSPEHSVVVVDERTVPRAIASDDWDVVNQVCRALGARQLDWFRSNDFVTPWLDVHARPIVELEPLLTHVVDRPFETDLRTAAQVLADAVHAFVEHYRRDTFSDPLLLGEDWRFFEWDDRVLASENGKGSNRWASRAAHLQQLASRVALAYEGFSAAASRNPKARQRIRSRA